jgi:DNA-binding CsgD family transcriptional regulator
MYSEATHLKLVELIYRVAGGLHPGGTIKIARNGQRPLQVVVAPLHSQSVRPERAVPAVAIFITGLDVKSPMDAPVFAEFYGLTPAEARLTNLLAGGASLKDASDQLGVRLSTVRSHLKSIFSKTGVTRQSELVRLFLTGPAYSDVG